MSYYYASDKKILILNWNLPLSSPKYSTEEDADAGEGRGEELPGQWLLKLLVPRAPTYF